MDVCTVSLHVLEDDASVEGRSFESGKELVFCRMEQVPAERHARKLGVNENCSVSISQVSLKSPVCPGRKLPSDSDNLSAFEPALLAMASKMSPVGEPSFDSSKPGMDRTRHHTTNTGNKRADTARHFIDGIDPTERAGNHIAMFER